MYSFMDGLASSSATKASLKVKWICKYLVSAELLCDFL